MINLPKYLIELEKLYPQWNLHTSDAVTVALANNEFIKFISLNSCEFVCYDPDQLSDEARQCSHLYTTRSQAELQQLYEWLETELANTNRTRTPWIVVSTHYPIFNIGEQVGDTDTFKRHLYPLLSKYKVDVLFTGHEHSMQYFDNSGYKCRLKVSV